MLSTSAFTADELAAAERELAALGVRSRYGDSDNAYVVLRVIGLVMATAADRHPDDPELRAAAAIYVTWRNLPASDLRETGGDLA